jgi:hypothetical protein
LSAALLVPTAVSAAEDERRLDVSAFVDGFYAFNFNRPADGENFFPGVATSGKRDNEFALNLAQIDLVLAPEPVGFHLALGYGSAPDIVHAAEPDHYENVVRASIQYQTKIGRGLLFEGGIYPSHIGIEAFASKDNWNYTRSWLGELSPYYQTGVKAAYPLSEHWSTQLHLLNGWQRIEDNNRGKSVGWQLAYSGERLTFSWNGITGPEQPDEDHDWRTLLDTVVQYEITESVTVAASADVAREELPAGADAEWYGIGLYGRFAPPDSRAAFALRAEYYDDEDGAISGFAQRLREITATGEYRPAERLILKLEGRYDRSSAPVFAGHAVDSSGAAIRDERRQFLVLASAVATF